MADGARSGRLGRCDWLDLGLAALSEHGPRGLTLETLCARAGRTRGSFYHHFADMEAFKAAVLDRWVERDARQIVAEVERSGPDVAARRARLDTLAMSVDHHLEVAVRRWAGSDAPAAAAVRRIDRERIAYLGDLYAQEGAGDAHDRATIEYAAFIGLQHLDVIAAEPDRAHRLAGLAYAALRTGPVRSRVSRVLSGLLGRRGRPGPDEPTAGD